MSITEIVKRNGIGRIVESSFRPHFLLRNPHLQTLSAALRPSPKLTVRIERLHLRDGDFIDLGWVGDGAPGAPIAVLVHGLTGGFNSKYMRGFARRLLDLGWRPVFLQLRGAGREPNLSLKTYNFGDTTDLRYVWKLLCKREPRVILGAVGWSLGANVVLKALGEEGDKTRVSIAAAVCAPFRIQECAIRMRKGVSRLYQTMLLRRLKQSISRKHKDLSVPGNVDLESALRARDFIEFDDAYTTPLTGFSNTESYYEQTSCGRYLAGIKRPTLIIHSLDDPFMDAAIVPHPTSISPYVTIELSRHGGHVGFVASDDYGRPVIWLEERLAEYFEESELASRTGSPTLQAMSA